MLDVDWSLGIPLVLHDGDMAGFHAPGSGVWLRRRRWRNAGGAWRAV